MLRVVAYHGEVTGRSDERVAVIAFEIDDQSAEELAAGLEALRATAGVLDVVQLPAFGKKGRLATQIQVLAGRKGWTRRSIGVSLKRPRSGCAGGSRRAPCSPARW